MNVLCIYHGNCADGFGAAWVVRRALGVGNVDFYPGVYQQNPPDVSDRHVLLVDFSYKRDVLDHMAETARSITILDHHKTAADDLAYFGSEILHDTRNNEYLQAFWSGMYDRVEAPRKYVGFDMNRSGAGITWDFFNPRKARPQLINHIEDRDLWRFKLANTREIQANLFSYPYDFNLWDRLIEDAELEGTLEAFAREGAAIERKHHKDIAELTEVSTRIMRIGGFLVPIANLPYTMASDAGTALCNWRGDTYPFAGCYYDSPKGRHFSLRSRKDGADVGKIAVQYGGGGHPNSSGFFVPFDQLAQFEP